MIAFGKDLGRYNLFRNEREWCLWLRTDYGNLSVTFPEDEEPSIGDALLDDLLPMFEERWKRFLYRSHAAAEEKILAEIRAHQDELDLHLCRQRAERAEKEAKRWRDLERFITEQSTSETVSAVQEKGK